ncbi:putative phage abortive infection protein [Bacillus cereus group sp. BfR-BA-01312]|uniref:putative phage abortive infection protein n=1 Tax=Bacillus cereus group sp. BfR-BA-01312 TaxID=2920289 RepID=UPI001F5A18ED|nr:putative phage abortive infection protein [Bacillus cereus group sp. BfR-BA-01312]
MNESSEKLIKFLTRVGVFLIFVAMAVPLIIKYIHSSETLAELGPIGDFIGGTTVAFLTAASVVLLLATIIMQRKEIKISQQSIEELVKQTEASIAQANEARKETQVTNETMKKQQFESTFFNMVNLQHNILKEIQYKDYEGRIAIHKLYKELKNIYEHQVYRQYKTQFINNIIISGNIDKLNDLIHQVLVDEALSDYKKDFEKSHVPKVGHNGKKDFKEQEFFYTLLNSGMDEKWNEIERQVIENFEMNIKYNREKCREILVKSNFKRYFEKDASVNHEYIIEFKMGFHNSPLMELKREAYESLYKKHENIIGHYYRNLYRIVKLIQNTTFNKESKKRDNEEKRMYRGILRAQLSSFELLMLFYNISYSEKGKKFKELVAGINFFDDHLIEKDFIWKNDVTELANLNEY